MTSARKVAVFLSVLLLSGLSAMAATVNYDFSYSGAGYTGSGTFVTSTTSTAGQYLITGVTGTANGSAITTLLAPGTFPLNAPPANDYLLFYPATGSRFFDFNGVSFTNAAGTSFNLYYSTSAYRILSGVGATSNGGGSLTSVVVTPSVAVTPEPSTFALLGTGVLGIAGVLRRRIAA